MENFQKNKKLYIWYIYDLLRSENIFSLANVDTSDSVYYDWIYGDSTSLSQLLTYGISKNWINMSSLTSEKYTSLQESYDVLVDYVISALDTDTAFFKKMYKYMINAGSISGRQVCMLLYEQGVLDMNADDSEISVSHREAWGHMNLCHMLSLIRLLLLDSLHLSHVQVLRL